MLSAVKIPIREFCTSLVMFTIPSAGLVKGRFWAYLKKNLQYLTYYFLLQNENHLIIESLSGLSVPPTGRFYEPFMKDLELLLRVIICQS